MKIQFTTFVTLFCVNILFSQNINNQEFKIDFCFRKSAFVIDDEKYLPLKNGDSVLIETLRFYISTVELLQGGKIVAKDKSTAHLIDAAERKTHHFFVNLPQNVSYNQIKFNLGIDSLTNVSGAMGDDLDPTKGMYWTWQSGYINFKLEGKNPRCKTRNNEFQLHLGGYAFPYNALQTIVLDIKDNQIIFDIEKLLNLIDYTQKPNIMSPCKEAVEMSKKIAKTFLSK